MKEEKNGNTRKKNFDTDPNIPDHVRIVADKLYAGRCKLRDICFPKKWGVAINLSE